MSFTSIAIVGPGGLGTIMLTELLRHPALSRLARGALRLQVERGRGSHRWRWEHTCRDSSAILDGKDLLARTKDLLSDRIERCAPPRPRAHDLPTNGPGQQNSKDSSRP